MGTSGSHDCCSAEGMLEGLENRPDVLPPLTWAHISFSGRESQRLFGFPSN